MNTATAPTTTQFQRTKHSVRSKDGTTIGFVRLGAGPALVFVHGSLATKEGWLPVANLLADRFTCFVMDRRGRGLSGEHPEYAIEKEYEDVEAVLTATGERPNLMGHSYGAVCALGAALRTPVRRMMLYEPPLPIRGPLAGPALAAYRDAIDEGNPERALELGLTQFGGIARPQFEALRATPVWPRLHGLAAGWTREIEAIDLLEQGVDRYASIDTPVLLLRGSDTRHSPSYALAATALMETLPDVRMCELQGHGHLANLTAPELVASRISEFLLG